MSSEMRDKILEFIRDEYLDDEDQVIDEGTSLITSGIVDSFSMVSLKNFLEDEYKISLSDEEASAEAFNTLNSILKLVRTKLGSE